MLSKGTCCLTPVVRWDALLCVNCACKDGCITVLALIINDLVEDTCFIHMKMGGFVASPQKSLEVSS